MTINKPSYILKKNERLSSKIQIDNLFNHGKSFIAYPLRIVYITVEKNEEELNNISILASVSKKKFKRAVKRNRVKRLIRESYRLNKHILYQPMEEINKNLTIAFIYLDKEIKDYSLIEKKMIEALNTLSSKIR